MTQMPGSAPLGYGSGAKPQGLSIAAMVLGIVSIVTFCFIYISVPCGVIAIVLAIVARGKIRRGEAAGEGLAKAGLILGVIGTAISILLYVLALVGLSLFGGKLKEQMEKQQRLQQQQQMSQPATPATPAPRTAPAPAPAPVRTAPAPAGP